MPFMMVTKMIFIVDNNWCESKQVDWIVVVRKLHMTKNKFITLIGRSHAFQWLFVLM